MIPTPRTLWILAITLLLGLITPWRVNLIWYWGALTSLVSIVIAFDLIAAMLRRHHLRVVRRCKDTLSLGVWTQVELRIENHSDSAEKIDLVDHFPETFAGESEPLRLQIKAHGHHRMTYRIKPAARGRHDFGHVQVHRYSPWSLWTRNLFLGEALEVRVFPNFSAVTKYALRGVDSMQSVVGGHIRQRRGEGLDFHQLREYRVGDTFRQIDWKATARSQKLISKEFQEERDQHVIFLIDNGHRMLARDGELSHFDHVLNTVLLLGYVALRQGDAVGYMTCEPDPRWMKPRKGRSTINVLSRKLYDLQPLPQAIDYLRAATELSKRQKRRALIILVTNIRDEDTEEIHVALDLLRQRHLVVVASLVEDIIARTVDKPVSTFADALDYTSTHNYLADRKSIHQALHKRGVFVHDTDCTALPGVLTDQYYAIKRAGML
ncbi:MAG: DUF58 domain-containing protein [Gammaproteobacteria bacterium]|nr:DUF58 domain-containing protein [Gammaproteobacteria bacterium]